jgi:hypothetical protein
MLHRVVSKIRGQQAARALVARSRGQNQIARAFASESNPLVCKFGGTSVAGPEPIQQTLDLLRADKNRRFVVVSAPGKRHADDIKVTDLLYRAHEMAAGDATAAESEAGLGED